MGRGRERREGEDGEKHVLCKEKWPPATTGEEMRGRRKGRNKEREERGKGGTRKEGEEMSRRKGRKKERGEGKRGRRKEVEEMRRKGRNKEREVEEIKGRRKGRNMERGYTRIVPTTWAPGWARD